MRYCPHCGAVNEEQDGRCFACARSLAGSLEVVDTSGQTQQQITRQKSKLTRRKLITSGIIITSIAAIEITSCRYLIQFQFWRSHTSGPSYIPPIRPLKLTSTRIPTRSKQELIIGLDTSQLPGYETIHFASVDEAGLISFWDENHKPKYQIEFGQAIHSLSWSPKLSNGHLLVATDHAVYQIPLKELTEGKNPRPVNQWQINLVGQPGALIIRAEYSSTHNDIVVVDRTGSVTVYKRDSNPSLRWSKIGSISGQNASDSTISDDNNIALDSSQGLLAILSGTNTLTTWSVNPCQKLHTVSLPIARGDRAITLIWLGFLLPDIAIGTEKGNILLWDYHLYDIPSTQNNFPSFLALNEKTGTIIQAISPCKTDTDGLNLLVTTDYGVSIWDYEFRTLRATIPKAGQPIEHVKAVASAILGQPTTGSVYIPRINEFALVTGENFVEFWRG